MALFRRTPRRPRTWRSRRRGGNTIAPRPVPAGHRRLRRARSARTAGRCRAPACGSGGRDAEQRGRPAVTGRPREGSRPPVRARRLLAALLDVAADELLGILLEHRVDLVEKIVDVLRQLLVTLGDLRVHLRSRGLVVFGVPAGPPRLRLSTGVAGCHGRLLRAFPCVPRYLAAVTLPRRDRLKHVLCAGA